MMLRYKNW